MIIVIAAPVLVFAAIGVYVVIDWLIEWSRRGEDDY